MYLEKNIFCLFFLFEIIIEEKQTVILIRTADCIRTANDYFFRLILIENHLDLKVTLS